MTHNWREQQIAKLRWKELMANEELLRQEIGELLATDGVAAGRMMKKAVDAKFDIPQSALAAIIHAAIEGGQVAPRHREKLGDQVIDRLMRRLDPRRVAECRSSERPPLSAAA